MQHRTYTSGLLREVLEEGVKELSGIVDALSILADNPDHCGLGIGLVEGVEVLAKSADNALVLNGYKKL